MSHECGFYMDDSYLDVQYSKDNLINDTILEKAGFVRSNIQLDRYMQDTYPDYMVIRDGEKNERMPIINNGLKGRIRNWNRQVLWICL